MVGELRFDRSIELMIFRKGIYDQRPSEVIDQHLFASNYIDKPIDIEISWRIVKCITEMPELAPARIDIGVLGAEYAKQGEGTDIMDFLKDRLSGFFGDDVRTIESKDVILYGFGRIGRLLARRIITTTGKGDQLRLKAIVVRPKLKDPYQETVKRMSLLKDDSIHGEFHGSINVAEDGQSVVINGNQVHMIFASNPEDVDYQAYGIRDAIVLDNTGVFRDHAGLSRHLRPGVDQVMLTAPGKDVPNIVHGVNQDVLNGTDQQVFSAASCTTNAIVPVIKTIDDTLGIEKGHIETIHAYTSDQNLLDNFHKKPRRGRGAAINMVLTTTGAAKAVSKVIPHLDGKLTGNAVRVPTPNVSLAIMALTVSRETDVEEVNQLLRRASLHGELVEQLHYSTSSEYVSSHAVGMNSTSVIDAPSTLVSEDGRNIIVYAWYDNEYGYCCQVLRLAKHAARVRRYNYY